MDQDKYSALWWTTTFGEWVREYGSGKLRRELEVTKSAVHSWVRGVVDPKPAHARIMIRLSRGRLTFDDIYSQPARVAALLEPAE